MVFIKLFNHLLKKLKQKRTQGIKKLSYCFAISILIAGVFLPLLSPKKATASGNVYNFGDIKFTESVQICTGPSGPCSDNNFIRVGQDQDFYVQVKITLAGITNTDSQVVTSLDFGNDEIFFPGWANTNVNIKGTGMSFVAKVTSEQVLKIAKDSVAAGKAPPNIPCYKESLTTTGGAITNAVVVVGAATAATVAGPAIASGALAIGGTGVGTAIGADSVALVVAYGAESSAIAGTAGGAAGAATLSQNFIPARSGDYIKCDGPVGGSNAPGRQGSGKVAVGNVVFEKIIDVPASSYKNLGLSQIANSAGNASAEPVNEFYVVPNVYFDSWLGLRNDFMSSMGSGKSVYVQLYDTQAHAVAHASDPAPSSVPNNGSNTGSGKNVTNPAGSDAIAKLINEIIGTIVAAIQEFLYLVFSFFIAPLISALLSIHPYKDSFVAVIYPGWIVVRNICNIFFILALIIIAMATLFRIEAYQYKHLIVQLIIAALLINFSLVIAQAILGLADTVQAQFLGNNVTAINSLALNLLKNNNGTLFNSAVNNANAGAVNNSIFLGTIQNLFWLALTVGSFCVFSAIAVFLAIRIVALWVLLLVSPIAYAAGVLPSTAGYRGTWWQNFLKYAFFTPIMAFFLNLTVVMVSNAKNNTVLQSLIVNPQGVAPAIVNFMVSAGSNVLILIFLLAGIKVAEQSGTLGAGKIAEWAQKGLFSPFGAAQYGASALGTYLQRKKRDATKSLSQEVQGENSFKTLLKRATFVAFNPVKQFEAFKKDAQKDNERAEHLIEAAAIDVKRQTPFFKEKGLASELAEAELHYIEQLKKERPYTGNEPRAVDEAINTVKLAPGSDKQGANFARQLLQLTENKGLNAFMDKYKGASGETFDFTPEGINALMEDLVNKRAMNSQMAGELRSVMSKIGYDTGQTVLYEGTNYHEGSPHPILFKTKKENGKRVIVGKDKYEAIIKSANKMVQDAIDNDKDVKAAYAKAIPTIDEENGITEDDVKHADAEFRTNLMDTFKKKLFNEPKNQHDHDLENYVHWEESVAQINSNLTKAKNANDVFTTTHWNSVGAKVNGSYELQDAALIQLRNIDSGTFFGLNRGQVQEKTLDTIKSATNNKTRVIQQRAEYLRDKDLQSGLKPKGDKEYTNLGKAYLILLQNAGLVKKLGIEQAKAKTFKDLSAAGLYKEDDHGWLVKEEKKEEKPKKE